MNVPNPDSGPTQREPRAATRLPPTGDRGRTPPRSPTASQGAVPAASGAARSFAGGATRSFRGGGARSFGSAAAGCLDGAVAPAGGESRTYAWLKRCIDAYCAAAGLLVAGPMMLLVAWFIRRDSPGPALFCQQRAGRCGRPFQLYKFRTMRTDADPFGDSPQSGDDPRITRIGRFLRETSLDELPQLLNVLRGEMSLVGPRPLYMQQMAEWNERQRRRLLVWPGLTGLAQTRGRASLTIEEKLEWDVRYVECVSLRTDLLIIARTAFSLIGGADIYEVQYSRTRARRSEHGPGDGAL